MTEPTMTAEIVTFRALPGTDADDLIRAARALELFLSGCEGFVARTLSCGPDGIWTDHVLWTRRDLALRAAERLMADPACAAFLSLIDEGSVGMTHAPVAVAQRAA